MTNLPVEFLDWDSNFFNRRIANVTTNSLTQDEAQKIISWGIDQKIDCIYYLADGNKTDSVRYAEAQGFNFIDLRVTLKKDLRRPDKPFLQKFHIRRANESDLDALKKMVRDTFIYSRFHVDEHFSKDQANGMFEVWIENDLRKKDHSILVIESDGVVVSFISYEFDLETKKAQLGLGATLEALRGRGLLQEMLHYFAAQLEGEGIGEVEVVTSGRNIATMHMLQRTGYFIHSIDLWYHKWFE
jgi:dTDP-4-amino-4,6-dideoxy-D-galactose acyltransferase